MKGTTWNGDYFASKGMTRSDGKYMFSVGGLVAFEVTTWSSPDGRDHSYGCVPTALGYKLQEEIVLEEFNNTESDRYGSGSYDVQIITELRDEFWHERYNQIMYKTFLLQILETNKNVFTESFIDGEITEVRNHSGKFLHIYEIPENYRSCKAESFEATVIAINLQKQKEEKEYADKVSRNFRGVELVFGITASGWYASGASFGQYSVQRQHEYDSTSRSHYKIVVMPCVPNGGRYESSGWSCQPLCFYLPNGIPMSLSLFENGEPQIDTMTQTSWCNSQSWHYCEIETIQIQKGWIFVDGVDVYDVTKRIIDENRAKKVAARNEKFSNAKLEALTAGFSETEITDLIKIGNGKVIATLKLATGMVKEDGFKTEKVIEIIKSLKDKNVSVISNYSSLLAKADKISLKKAQKAQSAFAWAYLKSILPQVSFSGYFDEAMDALHIAIEKNIFVKENEGGTTLEDITGDKLNSLKNKLA